MINKDKFIKLILLLFCIHPIIHQNFNSHYDKTEKKKKIFTSPEFVQQD